MLTSCSGPSKTDLKEMIRFEYNLTDIKIRSIEKSQTSRIKIFGTAKVESQVFEPVNLVEYCKVSSKVVAGARNKLSLDDLSIVQNGIEAGTEVDFVIKLAPDEVKAGEKPELITSGGWTNGAWGSDFESEGQRVTIFRTKAWYRDTKLIQVDSDEARELCENIRNSG